MRRQILKLLIRLNIAIATTALFAAVFYTTACNGGSGVPSINSFTLLYDIVAVGDYAGASWTTSNGDRAYLKATHENGTVKYDEQVPVNSDGVLDLPTTGWPAGEYRVRLRVTNSNGTANREQPLLLVGTSGIWFDFTKNVEHNPKDEVWDRITDELIPISFGQGIDDADPTISISKYVAISKIRWFAGTPWPDINSCPGAKLMTIRKGGAAEVFEIYREYEFPWPSFEGSYYCTSIWEPCFLAREEGSSFVLSILVTSGHLG